MRKDKIEELRKKLHKEINSYGRDSPKVLKVSKQLDEYIVKRGNNYDNKKL